MKKLFAAIVFAMTLACLPLMADAKDLYVRALPACALSGNGLEYGCATVAGGVGAIRGTAAIPWATVVPNDKVIICGVHEITNPAFRVTPTVSGALGKPITITGSCVNDPGVLDGMNHAAGIRLINLGSAGPINHFVIDGLWIRNVPNTTDYALSGHDNAAGGVVDRHITIVNNRFTNIGWIGMWLWGSEFTVVNNTLDGVGDDAIYVKGGKNTVIAGNKVINVSTNGIGGDCIQFDSAATQGTIGTGTVIVSDNLCDKRGGTNVKYGVLVGPVTGLTVIENNKIYCPAPSTLQTACSPIYINAAGTAKTAQVIIRGNFVSMGWRGITLATADNPNVRHHLTGNVIEKAGTFGVWLDANTDNVDVTNNVFGQNADVGLYLGKVSTTHRIENNIFYGNAKGIFYLNAPSRGHKYNDFFQNSVANITDSSGPKALDATDVTIDPQFTFTTDWKLPADSILRNVGQPLPLLCLDKVLGYCWTPANLGAY